MRKLDSYLQQGSRFVFGLALLKINLNTAQSESTSRKGGLFYDNTTLVLRGVIFLPRCQDGSNSRDATMHESENIIWINILLDSP